MSTNQPIAEEKAEEKKAPKVQKEIKNKEGKSNKGIAFLVTTLIFLAASGYLFYDNMRVKAFNEKQKVTLDSLDSVKNQLVEDLSKKSAEIVNMEGKNTALDSQLAAANLEIDAKIKKIKSLQANIRETKSLKEQIRQLEALKTETDATIQELKSKLAFYMAKSDSLTAVNSDLKTRLDELQLVNTDLTKKIEAGSQLRVENAMLSAQKKGSKGKFELAKSVKKANRLLLTFDVGENKIAKAGERVFYVRITDPKGKMLENNESGTFENSDHNLSFPYTKMTSVSYNNASQTIEMPIEIPLKQIYLPGNYNMEFYCDGYLCGSKKATIK